MEDKKIVKIKIGSILEKVNMGDGYADIDNLADKIYHYVIPEDSVVIAKAEYEKYQRIENTIKRFSTISPTEAESENKALKEEIAIILAQKRNIWKHYNQVCNDKEKIFIEIYKLLISIRKQDYEDSVPYYSENVEEFDDKLYELAKQFGIKIKE